MGKRFLHPLLRVFRALATQIFVRRIFKSCRLTILHVFLCYVPNLLSENIAAI